MQTSVEIRIPNEDRLQHSQKAQQNLCICSREMTQAIAPVLLGDKFGT